MSSATHLDSNRPSIGTPTDHWTARRSSFAGALVSRAIDTLIEWSERSRQRRQLMAMDEMALHDIGVTRADAVREGSKRMWER